MLYILLFLGFFSSAHATTSPDEFVSVGSEGQVVEFRGVWVTRWSWKTESDVRRVLREVDAAGFNAVFFQVRGEFDAYYASSIEPWAERLTGTLGKHPGWDPLAVAVDEAHRLGLELHAYINVFPMWKARSTPPVQSTPAHAFLTNPEWEVRDPSNRGLVNAEQPYHFASPGNPEVRFRVAQVSADIASRYAVDGIHLDYIRYPAPSTSRDAVSRSRYDPSRSWEDWQRDQVVATVAGVSAMVNVPVTAAVWGINENRWGWREVSQGRVDFYQDSHAFLKQSVLDAIVPMMYWPVKKSPGDRLDFRTLVADHVAHASGRHVYAGISAGLSYDQVVECIRVARSQGAPGVVVFDYTQIRPFMLALKRDVFQVEASTPKMTWR